jgi:putative molybdopterin biosynthesis protein
MIRFDEALQRFLALGGDANLRMGAERVAVDAALGRVLAEDVASPVDLPPFDHSATA